jgi:hypothetical protein
VSQYLTNILKQIIAIFQKDWRYTCTLTKTRTFRRKTGIKLTLQLSYDFTGLS